jgi:5-bromo-4-chloroindolyl phosphate hydrolysis protein
MKRLTQIDLTKMNEQSRVFYLNDLVADANQAFTDLTNNAVDYNYFKHILEHTTQAVLDLQQLINQEAK